MEKIKRLFQGRIKRVEWLIGNALILGLFLIIGVLQTAVLSMLEGTSDITLAIALPLGLLAWLFALVVGLSLNIRRLHDIGVSGWWILTAAIPLVNIAALFFLALKPGTSERNEYGEPSIKRGTLSMLFNA